ncbi:MAG: NAD(P)/FAD-dependent oxidoreductase [Flavobacteriales bacterium]
MNVVVIGGGAAGFFAAIRAAEVAPHARVLLLERTDKVLAKVRISGGGRCNTTHACLQPAQLVKHYPRGGRFLKKPFQRFGSRETINWFAERGVELKTEADGRMFPTTDDSRTIIDCLTSAAQRAGVEVRMGASVRALRSTSKGFHLTLTDASELQADRVIVTTGGHPKAEGYAWLAALGHTIVAPLPSLFTFNMPGEAIRELMGVVASPARVRIAGTDLESTGPLLITHWGMSGPAVLKLSAWGARAIHALGYTFTAQVNWLGGTSEHDVRERLITHVDDIARKQAINADPFGLPKRLWAFLLNKAGIAAERPWGELPHHDRNRMIDILTNDRYAVQGKTTFKEEFVTAGGIDLSEVDPATMESRRCAGLYFAGEVLDIDGVTGGFNFQAAWTTGYLAGNAMAV